MVDLVEGEEDTLICLFLHSKHPFLDFLCGRRDIDDATSTRDVLCYFVGLTT
jgi:hypothetical protein